MKARGWIWLAALFVLAPLASAEPEAAIAQAHEAYRAENFAEAARLYEMAVEGGSRSAALFYNLGNARFRAGEIGRAILNYERALALQPEHPEARANLSVARQKARALETPAQRWEAITGRATATQWTVAAACAFWIFAFAFAAWWMRQSRAPLLLFLSVIAGGALLLALGSIYALESGRHGANLGIVTAKNVQARVATADNASSVLALPPGSQIRILSQRGNWTYAALPNDLRGWIPTESVARVRL